MPRPRQALMPRIQWLVDRIKSTFRELEGRHIVGSEERSTKDGKHCIKETQ